MLATLIFIILFVVLTCTISALIGFEIADKRNAKETRDMFNRLATTEDEKHEIKFNFDALNDLCASNIRMLVFTLVLSALLFALNLWGYRNSAMENLKRGKFECEEVIRTKTRGDQVKMDTTYNFYRVKPEKDK